MDDGMFITIYMIGMLLMFAGCAIWAGVSDYEEKFLASVIICSVAMFWPLGLPLALLYYGAKFLKEKIRNKDI